MIDEVAKALMDACYGDGYWQAQHETQRDAFRKQAKVAIAIVGEHCAKIADGHVDPEWPNDDQSAQCKRIASDIRALTEG